MSGFLKKILLKILKDKGLEIRPIGANDQLTMDGALFRCMKRGVRINTVIDVGASDGSWSKLCRKYFPDARYLLIEAQEPHRLALDTYCRSTDNTEYIIAAASKSKGKVFFDNTDLYGGLASEFPFEKNCIEIQSTSIDSEVEMRKLKPPFLIKLDTHGYEVPILEGASETLSNTNLLVIETYNYRLTKDSLRYFEMAEYLSGKGFSTIDIADILLRKYDNSLWQMDTFYIPSESSEFECNTYD
jgi:FkbM family methyltransferase